MEKQQRRRKIVIRAVIIVLLVLVCILAQFYFRTHGYRTRRNNDEHIHAYVASYDLKEFTKYLLRFDPRELRKEEVDRFLETCGEDYEELENYNSVAYHFIKGALFEYEQNTRSAQLCYEKCITYYDPGARNDKLMAQIYGHCCYRLGVISKDLNHFEAMKDYFTQMEEILMENACHRELVEYYIDIVADYYEVQDGTSYATELAEKMVQLGNAIEYDDMGYLYYIAALVYSDDGNSAMFINYIMSALDQYAGVDGSGSEDPYYSILCLTSIGNEYVSEKNYELGRNYLTAAYAFDIEYDEKLNAETKAYVLLNLASLELKTENPGKAAEYLEECNVWISKEDRITAESDRILYKDLVANTKNASGDHTEAIKLLDSAYDEYLRCPHFDYSNFDITLYEDYGNIYCDMKRYDKALEYFLSAKAMIEFRGLKDKESCLLGIFKCYKGLGDQTNAIKAAEAYQEYLNERLVAAQSVQSAFFEYLNNEQSDTIIELENAKSNMYLVIIAVAAAFVVAVVLAVRIRNKKKQIEVESEEFHKLSEMDGLTGIHNRRSLDAYLEHNWEKLCDADINVGVVMIDVDQFKNYNDRYGHQMGDEVLKAVAEAFTQSVRRERDFVARYGGEEFIIIMPEMNEEGLISVLERIRANIKARGIPHEDSSVSDVVTVSMGAHICTGADEERNYENIIKIADTALYKAKEKRNCYIIN